MKKRLFSAFLTIVMLFTLIPASAVTAFAAVSDVPSGYTKVEYIESEGSSHIDTEWVSADATSSYAYEIEYAANEQMASNNTVLFGSNASSNRAACINFRSAGHTSVAFGKTSGSNAPAKWKTTTDKVKVKVEVDLSANTWNITKDGAAVESPTGNISGTPANGNSLYVFRNNNGSGGDYDSLAKVYGLKIWQDGTLVRDFVPCIETATATAGLYDLVNEKFHAAAGDGRIYGPGGAAKCTVTFTAPSDVVLTVSEGFTVGLTEQVNDGKTMVVVDPISQSTEGDITSHVYELAEGRYRFLAMGKDSVPGRVKDGAKTVKYYNWDKNFIVTAEDVARGTKTIDANPGLLGGKGFEQSNTEYDHFVRQYTDEMLASEALTVSDEIKAMYPEVFTTPTFTNTEGRARHQFSTQEEMEAFVAELDSKTDYMTTYWIGRSKGDRHDLHASFFTTEDIEGKSLAEAAEAIKANGKPTIYLHAQMHGTEQSGTEGALATMAYLCGDYGKEVIKTVNIVSVPRINPDGSEINKYASESGTGWRNINRDAMSLTQPETKAIIELYELIQPEVCLDHHEWRATISTNTSSLDDARLFEIISTNAPERLSDVQYELVDMLFDMYDDYGLRGYYYRFSPVAGPVTIRDYYSLRGSIAMLCETPGQRRGNQQWERRVLTQFLTAKAMIDWTVANADEVNEIVAAAKADLASNGKTFDPNNQFTLKHSEGTPIAAKRWVFDMRDGTPIEERSYTLYRNDGVEVSRAYPIYYIVPKDASGIADVLRIADMHGLEYSEVGADEVMELRGYTGDYTGASLTEPELMSFRNGAYKFPVAQERNAVVCTLMEPDILDSLEDTSPYLASYVIQGHLEMDEVFRCENDSEHALTFVPARDANCGATGCYDHYICLCGKAFAENKHEDALAEADYIIPVSGSHGFVEQADGSFACEHGCGATAPNFTAAVAACDGIGGAVKLSGVSATLSQALIVPADVTVDLNGGTLRVEAAITVNNGGAIANGTVQTAAGADVNLGENGGWVPVWVGSDADCNDYALCYAEAKTGKDIIYLDNGTKYSFGYKYEDAAAYGATVGAADNGKIKVGVNVALQTEDVAADYSFSPDSVDKMTTVGSGADDFFKVNLKLTGEKVDDVVATPYIKVFDLGFRMEGTPSDDYVPVSDVASLDGVNYTSLEAAVAAAEAAGGAQEIALLADATYKRPTTLKVNGNISFVAASTDDITISGPLTIDGQNKDGGKILFRVQDEAKLTLDGVTVQNYKYANASSGYGSVARVQDNTTLVMTDCTVKNCEGACRGAFYITGTATVAIDGCTFEGNKAVDQYGGALAINSSTEITVTNSSFIGNSAATYGGAIGLANNTGNNGTVTIDGCTFEGNTIDDIGKKSGEVVLEGEIKGLSAITLSGGQYIIVGETLALEEAASITVNDSVTVSGRDVNAGTYITEDGACDALPVYIASVGDTEYTSLTAAIEATADATSATTIELYGSETVTEKTTVTLSPYVQIKVTEDSVISGPLTIDGANKAHTTALPFLVTGSKLTLQNGVTLQNIVNEFKQNYCGMIRVQSSGELIFDGVTVKNCKGTYGLIGGQNNTKSFTIRNSTFANNESTLDGGILYAYGAPIVFENCTFTGNTSGGNGGVFYSGSSNKIEMTATNCTFTNNTASGKGGAISSYAAMTDITLEDCTFSGNKAGGVSDDFWYRSNGMLSLKGAISMETIRLEAGKALTLDDEASFAKTITLIGEGAGNGSTVLVGSKVADYYSCFAPSDTALTVNAGGKIVAK